MADNNSDIYWRFPEADEFRERYMTAMAADSVIGPIGRYVGENTLSTMLEKLAGKRVVGPFDAIVAEAHNNYEQYVLAGSGKIAMVNVRMNATNTKKHMRTVLEALAVREV